MCVCRKTRIDGAPWRQQDRGCVSLIKAEPRLRPKDPGVPMRRPPGLLPTPLGGTPPDPEAELSPSTTLRRLPPAGTTLTCSSVLTSVSPLAPSTQAPGPGRCFSNPPGLTFSTEIAADLLTKDLTPSAPCVSAPMSPTHWGLRSPPSTVLRPNSSWPLPARSFSITVMCLSLLCYRTASLEVGGTQRAVLSEHLLETEEMPPKTQTTAGKEKHGNAQKVLVMAQCRAPCVQRPGNFPRKVIGPRSDRNVSGPRATALLSTSHAQLLPDSAHRREGWLV